MLKYHIVIFLLAVTKKLMVFISSIFLCGTGFLVKQAIAQDLSSAFFDIQSVVNNESFVFQRVYFDGFQDNIRNCVFESPSVVWTIHYCHSGTIKIERLWTALLAGEFSIKENGVRMKYYLESHYPESDKDESNIYRLIEQGTMDFYINGVNLTTNEGSKMDITWSGEFPFLKTLARVQEQYIEQSIIEQPAQSACSCETSSNP